MMFHEVTFIAEEIHVWAKKGAFGSSSGSLPLRVANRGPSKGRRCLYYVRSIEDLAPNSFTMAVVNVLTAETRPRRSMTRSLWFANR